MGRASKTVARRWGVHPAVAYQQAIVSRLEATTGKPIEAWLRLVKAKGPPEADSAGVREFLRRQGVGHTTAATIAQLAAGGSPDAFSAEAYLAEADAYVAGQYAGKKAALVPLFEALLSLGLSVGGDVKACPCKTFVPLYRRHVIAQIKPTTNTRIDFGLALGATKAPKRLVDTGGFAKKDRITHRIEISSLDQIDGEVEKWLKAAYRADA